MSRAKRIIFTFRALGKTGQAPLLAQSANTVAPSGQNFMGIALMAHIPDQPIIRRVENIMDSRGQFDNAEPCPQMATGLRNRINGFGAQFIGKLAQLRNFELAQIFRHDNLIQ